MRDHRLKPLLWHTVFLSALAVLAGCKPSAAPPPPDLGDETTAIPCQNRSSETGPAYISLYCVTEFDRSAVNIALNAAEFVAQYFNWAWVDDPDNTFSSFSFRSVRTEFAHSIGLSGKGQTIAIVDDGFYTNHPELDGKQITLFGPLRPEDDHGTSVAAIAAGIKDDSEMMGVAYDANLHLTSFENSLSTIADATDDARQNGAIVQNNSWAYANTNINTILNRPNPMTAEEAFSNAIGVSLTDGTKYLGAIENFTQSGVVVFSNSNNELSTNLGIMEALPLAFPQLESGWITALNGVPVFNDEGDIVSAQRISAECFNMAKSCLMAEGVVYATSGESSYDYPQVGTSFAAPIISGGIAILAEAFPTLDGPEIRDRLLVTADNSFFTAEDTRIFTPDISHGYSSEYGHGFMNLEAALLPIGSIGVPTGLSVSDGSTPIQQASIATGFAQGGAVATALQDVDVMLIDSLGGNFTTAAETFVISTNTYDTLDQFGLFADNNQPQSGVSGALKSLAFALNISPGTQFVGGNSFDVLADIGLLPARSGLLYAPITMSELPAEAYSFGAQAPINSSSDLAAYAFASNSNQISNSQGAGIALQFGSKSHRLSLGTSIMQENGSSLGIQSLADTGMTSVSRAIDFGYSASIDKNLSFSANAQVGNVSSIGRGIWDNQNNTTFSAYGIALNISKVFSGNDLLVASIRQPIAIDGGSMAVALPQSRDINGNILSSILNIDLAPDERQLDLGFEYEFALDRNESIRIGAAYISNGGNVTGEHSTSVAMSYSLEF